MIQNQKIESRRAIEALRAGVPNLDAVKAIGSSQPELEKTYRSQLNSLREDSWPARSSSGMLIAGGFGTGKSHLLEYFKHLALEENYICSKIVISKETPLYHPAKIFQAAVSAAEVPGRRGSAISEIAAQLNFKSEGYRRFVHWVNSAQSGLSSQFAATLYVFEYARGDDEIRDRILRFWGGDPLNISEIRRALKELGESSAYKVEKTTAKALALQRYQFMLRLILSAGYSGWVWLVDEAELIGRYSLKQRARSYAEIARLMGKQEGANLNGLNCVFTISDDFESAVMDYRNDEERIPLKLNQSSRVDDVALVSQAEKGMHIIRRQKVLIERLNAAQIRATFEKVRSIYAEAYQWQPAETCIEQDVTARIRQHIKRWITEWDLLRLYPDYQPRIVNTPLLLDYREIPEIENHEVSL